MKLYRLGPEQEECPKADQSTWNKRILPTAYTQANPPPASVSYMNRSSDHHPIVNIWEVLNLQAVLSSCCQLLEDGQRTYPLLQHLVCCRKSKTPEPIPNGHEATCRRSHQILSRFSEQRTGNGIYRLSPSYATTGIAPREAQFNWPVNLMWCITSTTPECLAVKC